jgi:fucose permease
MRSIPPDLASRRRLVFFTLFMAYVSAGIVSILPGPTLPLLAANTSVPLDIAGIIFTTSATGFVFGVFIAGILSGKFGPKYVLLSGMALMGFAGIATPLTHVFSLLLIVQFIQGIGFGFLDVSINIVVTLVFGATLGESLNNLHSSYGVGALVAPLLLSISLQTVHNAFPAYLIGSIVALAGILFLVRQPIPAPTPAPSPVAQRKSQSASDAPVVMKSILKNPLLWLMAVQMGLYVAAEVGFSNWIVTAVHLSANISLALAAPCATFFWIGLTAGRLMGAQLLKRALLSENQLLFLAIVGGGLSGLIVAGFPGILFVSFSASALVGFFFGPIFPGIMAIASRWFANALSTVSGTLLISAGAAAMILPALMGLLIQPIGVGWVMALPALVCLSICVPFVIASQGRKRISQALQLPTNTHRMEKETQSPITP